MLDEEQLRELEKALFQHATWLTRMLHDPEHEHDDSYINLAGQLRVLLCDRDTPILISYAEERVLQLPVYLGVEIGVLRTNEDGKVERRTGPCLLQVSTSAMGEPTMTASFIVPKWTWDKRHETVPMREYLHQEMGLVSVESDGARRSEPYTLCKLIKWVANKDGIAHLDLKKPAAYKALRTSLTSIAEGQVVADNLVARKHIVAVAAWCQEAIHYVLEKAGAAETLRTALTDLDDITLPPPDTRLPCFYATSLNEYFEGDHSGGINELGWRLYEAFGWHGLVKIVHQLDAGRRCFFEIGTKSSLGTAFKIFLEPNGELGCELRQNGQSLLRVSFKKFTKSKYFYKYIYLSCQFYRQADDVILEMQVDNEVERQSLPIQVAVQADEFVLGQNLREDERSTFFIKELILVGKKTSYCENQQIAKALWLRWKDDLTES